MNINALKWVTDALGSWLNRLSGQREKKNAADDEAIRAFLAALQETRFFLGGKASEVAPQQRNRKLSDLWLEAARLVRKVDPVLADRCQAKARFWADPAGWDPRDRQEANILIGSMERTARRLLTGK